MREAIAPGTELEVKHSHRRRISGWVPLTFDRLNVRHHLYAFALATVLVSAFPLKAGQKPSAELRPKPVATAVTPTIVTEQPPAIALAPKEAPPTTPQVVWDGSQLTITTDNSTLSDILAEVRAHTGADILMPEGAATQRMAARLGPGPVREVLSALLGWTGFNYVIQASEQNPDEIKSILLIPRPKDEIEVAGSSPRSRGAAEYRQPAEPTSSIADAQDPSETQASTQPQVAVESVPTSVTPEATPSATAGVPATVADLQPSSAPQPLAGSNSSSAPTKVPSQMIEQLQSMYQQRLQLQESGKTRADQVP